MKKYFILFICLVGILFSSCMEKEDPYSWSIGQMEIDEPTTEEKVELPSTAIKRKSKDAIVLQTKCMEYQMLVLVQIPDNPVSKYSFWKDSAKEHYAIIGLVYTDADHHNVRGKVYTDLNKALSIFNEGKIRDDD